MTNTSIRVPITENATAVYEHPSEERGSANRLSQIPKLGLDAMGEESAN